MSRDDYEAISKLIEDIVGKDTITAVKLLEGIKFYFDNKIETIKVVRTDTTFPRFSRDVVTKYKKDADKAMEAYTAKLKKENLKFKKKNAKNCAITGWE